MCARTLATKHHTSCYQRPNPPPPSEGKRHLSAISPAATACAQAFLYSWPIDHKLTTDQWLVAGLSSAFAIYWLWCVWMYDDEWHLWCTGLTCAGVLSVNHFWNRA